MLFSGLLIIPFVGTILLAILGSNLIAKIINVVCCLLTFVFSLGLSWKINQHGALLLGKGWFYLDSLNIFIIVVTTFIGLTTSIYSLTYLNNEQLGKNITQKSLRFYYSIYQFFLLTALLILTTNNIGILWVAMEGATLSTVVLVALYLAPESLEAAWKYLILCGVGLAQALLGIILLYFTAAKVMDIHNALFWTQLYSVSNHLSPHITMIAFVFILIGFGTKVGFVPLHNWLPDAYGESIAPVQVLLSGILLNAAFYGILRFKIIVDGAVGSSFTNHFLIGFGLLNVLVASFFLLRQQEIKRLFAYSSIEHVGLMSFAFGLGTPLAILAGMLHIIGHSLSKSAVFFSTGQIIQLRKTSSIDQVRGVIHDHPLLGWGMFLGCLSLLGVPPFALFTSEFLILFSTIQQYPLLAILLVIGLSITFAAILYKVQRMIFTETPPIISKKLSISYIPIYVHLILVLFLGFFVPLFLMNWANQIAQLMGI